MGNLISYDLTPCKQAPVIITGGAGPTPTGAGKFLRQLPSLRSAGPAGTVTNPDDVLPAPPTPPPTGNLALLLRKTGTTGGSRVGDEGVNPWLNKSDRAFSKLHCLSTSEIHQEVMMQFLLLS